MKTNNLNKSIKLDFLEQLWWSCWLTRQFKSERSRVRTLVAAESVGVRDGIELFWSCSQPHVCHPLTLRAPRRYNCFAFFRLKNYIIKYDFSTWTKSLFVITMVRNGQNLNKEITNEEMPFKNLNKRWLFFSENLFQCET